MNLKMRLIPFFVLFILSFQTIAQTDSVFNKMQKMAEEIDTDTTLNLKFTKYEKFNYTSQLPDSVISKRDSTFMDKNKGKWNSYSKAEEIIGYIHQLEAHNFSTDALTNQSNQLLQRFNELESLSLLLNFAENNVDAGDAHYQMVRKKLIATISEQMQLIAGNTRAWYNYSTLKKRWLKGVQIESSNDLFKPNWFQTNHDMDYTGSLKLSLITDMFKLDLGQPSQSYQVITYGGEVYTAYFKDTSIFVTEDTFNINDRPHGCFQYFGFENHGIAKDFASRWTTNMQVGLIGGRFGYNFQLFLHRDVTLSPFPSGWDAQVAFPGRLTLQATGKYERLLLRSQAENQAFPFVPSASLELAFGYFMTYAELGLNFSTHNFKNKNPNNALPQTQCKVGLKRKRKTRWYADLSVAGRYVQHNTMLEGFGVWNTNEIKDESFAEASQYILHRDSNEVRPFVLFTAINIGVQFPSFNLFYTYNIKSPEYNSDGLIFTNTGEIIDPNKRWHQYGTLGVAFLF